MTDQDKIQEERIISDLETLKAVSDALRMQILQYIGLNAVSGSPTTVKELADHLKLPPTKLYYHVNLLEKFGLIRIAETRLVSGIVEKRYTITARRFRVAVSGEGDDKAAEDLLQGALPSTISSIFDSARSNFEMSHRHRLQQGAKKQDQSEAEIHLQQCVMRLTPAQAKEFSALFEALVDEFRAHKSPEGQIFGLTIAFGPYYHLKSKDSEEKS